MTANSCSNKDLLTIEHRSWNMSRIRSKDTVPEKIARSVLRGLGYRFRLHVQLQFKPERRHWKVTSTKNPLTTRRVSVDILLPRYKTAIFVHGCFWHRHKGCGNCTTPTHRKDWWLTKLEGNVARDQKNQNALKKLGWRTLVVWECQTKNQNDIEKLRARLDNSLGNLNQRE